MFGRSIWLGAALLIAAPCTVLATEPETVEYAPSSHWHLDYAEAHCRIVRTFGEGDDRTVLFLQQYDPSEAAYWLVAGGLVDKLGSRQKYTVQFGPASMFNKTKPRANVTLGDFGDALQGFLGHAMQDRTKDAGADEKIEDSAREPIGLPALSSAYGESIEWMEFSRRGKHYRLKTGELGAVFDAMNTCMASLVKSWGADPSLMKSRATEPVMTNFSQVSAKIRGAYPWKAQRNGESATLLVRAMVDSAGAMTSCHITEMTEAINFNVAACDTLRQMATFEPARDTAGNAIASYYTRKIYYVTY